MCNPLGIIVSLLAITSIGVVGYNSYMIYENKEVFSCGNLDIGFIVGLAGYTTLFLSSIFGFNKCAALLAIGSLAVIGTFAYNIYLYTTLSESCKTYYNSNEKLFWYYKSFIIVNIFTTLLILLYYSVQCIFRKSNRYRHISGTYA